MPSCDVIHVAGRLWYTLPSACFHLSTVTLSSSLALYHHHWHLRHLLLSPLLHLRHLLLTPLLHLPHLVLHLILSLARIESCARPSR